MPGPIEMHKLVMPLVMPPSDEMKQRELPIIMLATLLSATACNEHTQELEMQQATQRSVLSPDEGLAFRDDEPIGPALTISLWRKQPSALQVVERARMIAIALTGDTTLPRVATFAPPLAVHWEALALANPERPATVNLSLNGHSYSASYRPSSDALLVLSKDTVGRPPAEMSPHELDGGVGREVALTAAKRCMDELAHLGAIPEHAFSPDPVAEWRRRTAIAPHDWIDQYNFTFAPKVRGIPVRDMDVQIGIEARSGRCRLIQIVTAEYSVVDTITLTVPASAAKAAVESELLNDPKVSAVHVSGYVGYLHNPAPGAPPVTLAPRYIFDYSIVSSWASGEAVSRTKTAAIDLTVPGAQLVEIYD